MRKSFERRARQTERKARPLAWVHCSIIQANDLENFFDSFGLALRVREQGVLTRKF